MDLQLGVDALDVEVDRVGAALQDRGGRFVVVTVDHELQQPLLVGGQLVLRAGGGPLFAEQRDHPPGDHRADGGAAGDRVANCLQELFRPRLLEQVA
jgi:hypothetical protein